MTGSIFSGVSFWATDLTGAAPQAGGQGFAMSSSEMRAMLKKAMDVRISIQQQRDAAQVLSQATPPAQEPASTAAVVGPNGVNESGRYYQGHLDYQYNYLSELITRLQKALGMVEAADQQAASDTNKTSGALE
ncbi:hypothetical protein SAMN05421837_10429 [Amycolatopsis pretoriensis]|uniref:PE family protein n=1 Tax=Amycolatopsis pretoriensis TaxID=218821 RepID=A0A1H5QRZ3_9PSEU|nr:hypothetical protein [Amycolatopsis pretoriensis]SEF28138.1 hypothetical protein SAMN05421837_10429 [Amycolatopsis pretoriensis]